jgi:hypothetical protein
MNTEQPKKKTGGRLKGQPNKISQTVKQRIDILVERNWKQIQIDLDSLSPKDRLTIITNLLPFVLPKMASTTNEISLTSKLEGMTTIQLETVVNQILLENE